MISDATREKDESHAGKVVERSWYNRFKHVSCERPCFADFQIFPASRWEVYDPDKDYGAYVSCRVLHVSANVRKLHDSMPRFCFKFCFLLGSWLYETLCKNNR